MTLTTSFAQELQSYKTEEARKAALLKPIRSIIDELDTILKENFVPITVKECKLVKTGMLWWKNEKSVGADIIKPILSVCIDKELFVDDHPYLECYIKKITPEYMYSVHKNSWFLLSIGSTGNMTNKPYFIMHNRTTEDPCIFDKYPKDAIITEVQFFAKIIKLYKEHLNP